MIDECAILSHGGLVLWRRTFNKVVGNPVNQLIKNVVLEERVTEDGSYVSGEYRLRYMMVNEFELILVVIMQKMLQLLCTKQLLDDVRDDFVSTFEKQLKSGVLKSKPNLVPTSFDDAFDRRYERFKKDEMSTRRAPLRAPEPEKVPEAAKEQTGDNQGSPTSTAPRAPIMGPRKGSLAVKKPEVPKPKEAPKVKKARDWGGSPREDKVPTWTPPVEGEAPSGPSMAHLVKRDANGDVAQTRPDDWSDPEEEPVVEAAVVDPKKRGRFSAFLRNRFGDRELDDADLATVLPALREKLIAKNVAVDVADKLIASVSASLQGKRLGHFDVLHKVIQDSLIGSLQRILTPKREVNILRDAARCRDELMRPYIICFCGVNGVGKSTSLSKIAFLLKQSEFSVIIAACDTFRGGAVEQLQVHCTKIGIPLHAQGYGQDASQVASNAIARAQRERINVVLIDTAGRMQDHESRMTALAKLVHENKPDLTLFVGEALVGCDGAHQLQKFNECFVNLTPPGCQPRGIDGIFLTKFDTIDDKVGAAVSMVYQCGQPIVFAGVGQTYQDLKRLNPEVIAKTLMM